MIWKWVLIAVCLVLSSHAPAYPTDHALDACIGELRGIRARFERWIPAGVVGLDQRLNRMLLGISYLEENAKVLARSERSPSSLDFHLIGNALASCERYRDHLVQRWKGLFYLFYGTLISGLFALFSFLIFLWNRKPTV